MKSLRSVNYSRLLNCRQTNQKFYLNLLGLLHYLASKIEKNNTIEGGILESHCEAWSVPMSYSREAIYMQEELDSPETFTVNLKLMLSQVLEASGLLRSIISPVMMAWLCMSMCAYVSRWLDTYAVQVCICMCGVYVSRCSTEKERCFHAHEELQGYTTFGNPQEGQVLCQYLYLNVLSKNHIFSNIKQGSSYLPLNEPSSIQPSTESFIPLDIARCDFVSF